MFFVNPTYLWALLGLLVPLAIHLWSKKDGRTIKIGSTKLLSESDSKQSRSIQFNEIFLLVLRMLVLGILVFIIAGINIKKKITTIPITYIVESSLLEDDRMRNILDTLETGESLRLLQSGFPELDTDQLDAINTDKPNYWQLAQEMETLQTDSIVVFTSAFVTGIQGMRPSVTKSATWIPIDAKQSVKRILKATKRKDSLELVSLSSDQYQVSFTKKLVSIDNDKRKVNDTKDSIQLQLNGKQETIALTSEIPTKVLLFYEDSLANQKTYVAASLKAISKYIHRPIDIEIVQDMDVLDLSTFQLVVWLSSDSIPETSSKILVYQPDHLADTIIEESALSNVFYLTAPLTLENSVDRNLPEQLLRLFDFYKHEQDEIDRYDKRSIDITELQPISATVDVGKKQFRLFDISKWLWLLLGVLLVTERSVAKFRKQ
ncbi:BatA domain-containing protein [uncultured Aquimarina sp.]|uniref:BatA domain-containing protein n=1 Tax=uncultured Aquimarina sp. TaxID=575652 RepID=UPI002606EEF2|nr:BatA domain-containing protein [uncultured Aquimarina sp.]